MLGEIEQFRFIVQSIQGQGQVRSLGARQESGEIHG